MSPFIGIPFIWVVDRLRLRSKLILTLPKGIAGHFHWGGDPFGITASGASHLRISQALRVSGRHRLSVMGLDLSQPVVCLHVRDSAYHQKQNRGHWRETNNWRNLDAQAFGKAAQWLSEAGFQVVRLGTQTAEPLIAADEKAIFDYAVNGHRSEDLDVLLASECSLMISTASGIDAFSQVFRRPILFVGLVAPWNIYVHRPSLSILQLFREIDTGRILTLSESLSLTKISDEKLNEEGLVVVPNSPDEIVDATREAVERIHGTWRPTAEDKELQTRFVSLLPSEYRRFPIRGAIGAAFLRSHESWLI